MRTRPKLVCEACGGTGRVVDERQPGEKVATCMTCRGNGWVYAPEKAAPEASEPAPKLPGARPER